MNKYTYSTSLMGRVTEIHSDESAFYIKCRSGDFVKVRIGRETQVKTLKNTDKLDRDRIKTPENYDDKKLSEKIKKYIKQDILISVYGIYIRDNDKEYFDARIINLCQDSDGRYLFEDGHWWLTQISNFADTWLNYLFKENDYDFTKYQTYIGISGAPDKDNKTQECATLSRLIYGLSSAYLLTGSKRFLDAAQNGVAYQREWFRSISNDGKYCFWAAAKRNTEVSMPSQNPDDFNTIPLYEQIYCLAGLAQYYRITQDWKVLEDIKRTINTFYKFFYDEKGEGFFSHIDYATLSSDTDTLGDNKLKKNWNSIGDHIPAYLINVILALDPLPKTIETKECLDFIEKCRKMLKETTTLIVEKFPDKEHPEIPYVIERFHEDWKPDLTWGWQQNRAICGHNLKIAWNLTRVAYYCEDESHKNKLIELADKLATDMGKVALDQVRGGVFDAVERKPSESFIEFTWGNSKDFWQQEQGILAYLIMYGYTGKDDYLELARETMFFWNLYFLDLDLGGIYFRTTDDGLPFLKENYANKGGHSVAGYHALELNYLAHVYIRSYVKKEPFCLFFKPAKDCGHKSINVLPDFFDQSKLIVEKVIVSGIERTTVDPDNFQIELNDSELGSEIIVQFRPL
ncbi:MAG: AGE family epimerase/isomerase [bacterium]